MNIIARAKRWPRKQSSRFLQEKIKNRNTKVIINLPVPSEILPDWIKQRREFIDKFIDLGKEFKKQTLSN